MTECKICNNTGWVCETHNIPNCKCGDAEIFCGCIDNIYNTFEKILSSTLPVLAIKREDIK